MDETPPTDALRLERIAGPEVVLSPIAPGGQAILGRSEGCDVALVEETVSRKHASIQHRGNRWVLEDLGSKHGTLLNAIRLTANAPVAVADQDMIRIGPWTFRVNLRERRGSFTLTVDDSTDHSQRVERLSAEQTARLAQHRMDLLIDCAAAITGATNERALADAVLKSALQGSGFHRAALLRQHSGSEEVEVLGHLTHSGPASLDFCFSRSLLREAAGGQIARLATEAKVPAGASIAELDITAALCAPIMLGSVAGSAVAAYLYLDARGQRSSVAPDAAGFCQVIARLCGLALVNIKRLEMEERQRRLEREISAARQAQVLIVPADHGIVGQVHYAMKMRPGRFVAGDLFDVIELDDGRIAALIGDVTGEGVGAAMLMVAAQSHLHAALQQHRDAAVAVNTVNRYLGGRCGMNKFISMWVGVFDLARGDVLYVDAGHGHWLHKAGGESGGTSPVTHAGGIPVGIDPTFEYRVERLGIARGDRIILYSDGVVEQRSPGDEQFGRDRVIRLINRSSGADNDVLEVLNAVESFAGRTDLSDDTTVASIEWKV